MARCSSGSIASKQRCFSLFALVPEIARKQPSTSFSNWRKRAGRYALLMSFPWFATSCASTEAAFSQFERRVALQPLHSAVAIAKDRLQWAWGGCWNHRSQDAASVCAVERCITSSRLEGVAAPCRIYAVDGIVK